MYISLKEWISGYLHSEFRLMITHYSVIFNVHEYVHVLCLHRRKNPGYYEKVVHSETSEGAGERGGDF